MSNQLDKITKQYRKFKKGQSVEHTQFNEFLTYFEDQERLSRTQLNGVGIICGFTHKITKSIDGLNRIAITQGTGLTTDGDLVNLHTTSKKSTQIGASDLKTIDLTGKNYSHFKAYDNYKVNYKPFFKEENTESKQIDLWELATEEEAGTDHQSLEQLNSLEDKYVVIYVESYEKEVKPCKGVDCDNQGVQQIANVKVLLTNKEGIDNIANLDVIYQTKDVRSLYTNLPEVNIKRIVLAEKSNSIDEMRKLYANAILEEGVLENLDKGFTNITKQFATSNSFNKEEQTKILKELISAPYGFQYGYDFIKELAATYNEIKTLLPKLNAICFPNVAAFPKHLMGGKLIEEKGDTFRHQFYGAPILDEAQIEVQVRLLIDRFNLQVRAFKSFSEIEKESGDVKTGLRITPSQEIAPLGKKAIPFYYKLDSTFLKKWNFTKTNHRIANTNLSYGTTAAIFSNDLYIQKAIDFNLQNKSFYRIEGHQGKKYNEAQEILNKQKETHQLPFDVMVLSLEELKNNKDLSKAYYADYLEKHTGLQHLAGVKPGGTFVMIYESEKNNIVFADFSLPYFCCGKKEKTSMSLPVNSICENDTPFPIMIEPLNGVVKPFIEGKEVNGVVTQQGGKNIFNPSVVLDADHGKTIMFTVNDQASEIELMVYAQTELAVTIDTIEELSNGEQVKVKFLVTAVNEGDLADINEYQWNFGDTNLEFSIVPNALGIVEHIYDLVALKKSEFKPSLFITNSNECSTQVEMPLVDVGENIFTIDCVDTKGMSFNGSTPYTFLIDYGTNTGKAGIRFWGSNVEKVVVEWNNKVFEYQIDSGSLQAQSKIFSFIKDLATPATAKVTVYPKRGDSTWNIQGVCIKQLTSVEVKIGVGDCDNIPSTWIPAYVSVVKAPEDGDTIFTDTALSIPFNGDKQNRYRMSTVDDNIYEYDFAIDSSGIVNGVNDCNVVGVAVRIAEGDCARLIRDWTTVYVKSIKQPAVNDVIYTDVTLKTPYSGDGKTLHNMSTIDGLVFFNIFSIENLTGKILKILDCNTKIIN